SHELGGEPPDARRVREGAHGLVLESDLGDLHEGARVGVVAFRRRAFLSGPATLERGDEMRPRRRYDVAVENPAKEDEPVAPVGIARVVGKKKWRAEVSVCFRRRERRKLGGLPTGRVWGVT